MTNTMLLYKNVTALSRDEHRKLRLRPAEGFAFAAATHWLPVAGAEFYAAARAYPIMFVNETAGDRTEISPILLVGLEAGHNDYVDNKQQWRAETYLPAFVRRYPFVLATAPEQTSEFTVCFDATSKAFSENEGQPLFGDDGSASALLNEVIAFMNGFTTEMTRTRRFVEELKRLDLLETRSAQIRSPDGGLFNLQDFLIVSEEKFGKLEAEDLAALHKEGFLGWVFAHLMSLGNLPELLKLHQTRKRLEKMN
jgi:hypothetical protein